MRVFLIGQGSGVCFNMHDGRPTGRRTILLLTSNMEGWSVARSDGPSCLLKQVTGGYRRKCHGARQKARSAFKIDKF